MLLDEFSVAEILFLSEAPSSILKEMNLLGFRQISCSFFTIEMGMVPLQMYSTVYENRTIRFGFRSSSLRIIPRSPQQF